MSASRAATPPIASCRTRRIPLRASAPSIPTKAAPGSVWIVNGQRVIAGNPGANLGQHRSVSSAPQAYGLVYVNRKAQINTLDRNGRSTLRSVADSCWNSIMGGRISQLG